MKLKKFSVGAACFGLLFGVVAVHGHHSFDAEYDRNQPLTITGTVVEVQWTNPHARIYVDGPDPDGPDAEIVHWDFELGPPNGLMRRGLEAGFPASGNDGHCRRLSNAGAAFECCQCAQRDAQ